MSIEAISQSLETLIAVHEDLCEFSEQKTEIIKGGSVEMFQKILAEERKYAKRLLLAEEQRQKKVEKWYIDHQLPLENMTITNMLEIIPDEQEQFELEQLTIRLTKVITQLKQQEQLNYDLIQQSMQFVQLSLDMLSPTINNMNYGKKHGAEATKRSVFDSKA